MLIPIENFEQYLTNEDRMIYDRNSHDVKYIFNEIIELANRILNDDELFLLNLWFNKNKMQIKINQVDIAEKFNYKNQQAGVSIALNNVFRKIEFQYEYRDLNVKEFERLLIENGFEKDKYMLKLFFCGRSFTEISLLMKTTNYNNVKNWIRKIIPKILKNDAFKKYHKYLKLLIRKREKNGIINKNFKRKFYERRIEFNE